ncbi:MAG TPA: hypothetical protein VFT64_12515 [Rickettsiales bacterium]|nr:hypothetical protein [Rickettsiales bacterium]
MEQVTDNIDKESGQAGEDHHAAHTKPSLNKSAPFWSTIIPVLVSRQLFQSINKLAQPFEKGLEEGKYTSKPARFAAQNAYSLFFGGLVTAVSGFYAKRNLEAIKTLYADAVGAELGKPKDNVTLGDILFRSKNEVVRQSAKEFWRTGLARSAVISTFFAPWHLLTKSAEKPHNIQASIGAGAMGLYVLQNRFRENTSLLEALQTMVDTKLHHNNSMPYDMITANDIGNMLVIQHKTNNRSYHSPSLTEPTEKQEMAVSQRLADLLNATYHNTDNIHSHFTLGNLIYLMGMEAKGTGKTFLEQPYPVNMAYINLADKHKAKDIEAVASAIASGTKWQDAFAQYGITVPEPQATPAGAAPEPSVEQEQHFTRKFAPASAPATSHAAGMDAGASYTQKEQARQSAEPSPAAAR